jgi:hypothetical protein
MPYVRGDARYIYKVDQIIDSQDGLSFDIDPRAVYYQFMLLDPVSPAVGGTKVSYRSLGWNKNVWILFRYYGFEFARFRVVQNEMLFVLPEEIMFCMRSLAIDIDPELNSTPGFYAQVLAPIGQKFYFGNRNGIWVPG